MRRVWSDKGYGKRQASSGGKKRKVGDPPNNDNKPKPKPKADPYQPKPLGKQNLRRRARQDVRLYNQPALNELARQQRLVEQDQNKMDTAAQEIYKGLKGELGNLQGADYGAISGDLNARLGELGQQMGDFGLGPAGEQAAAAEMFGGAGAGAQASLAGMRARNLGYSSSVKEQAAVDVSNRRQNYLETMRDAIGEIRNGRMDIFQDMGAQRKQRLDELRDARFQQGLDLGAYGLQREEIMGQGDIRKYLIEKLKGEIGKGGNKGGGGGGGKNKATPTGGGGNGKDKNGGSNSDGKDKGDEFSKHKELTNLIQDINKQLADLSSGPNMAERRKKLERKRRRLRKRRKQLGGQAPPGTPPGSSR